MSTLKRWKFEIAISWIWNLEISSFPMMYDSNSPSQWYHLGEFWLVYHGLSLSQLQPISYKLSLRNENDLKEMKGRTETFRGSFIPHAIKRYNYNQKGNVINRNDYIIVEMNRKLFEYGNQATAVKHAQLRMKCNLLSGHLYDLHVVDSPACQCGFDFEDINHFFFNCPLFGAERTELLTNLLTL